ncbi:MAG: putative RND superfamily exporter protein [Cellvibrionaceae bacterium]
MEKYLQFVGRFPKTILLLLTLTTLLLGYMTIYLTEDSNPYLLPEDHPARSSLYEMREEFTGTYDSILIALYNKDSILNKHSMKAIFELSQQSKVLYFTDKSDLEQLALIKKIYPQKIPLTQAITSIVDNGLNQRDIPRVRAMATESQTWEISEKHKKYFRVLAERLDPIREMAGLSSSENVFLESDGTLRATITVDSTDSDIAHVKSAITDNELVDNGIVDKRANVGLIVIEVSLLSDDSAGQVKAYSAVNKMVVDYMQANPLFKDDIYIGGVPVFFAEQKKILDADMETLFPLVILFVTVILAVFFRTILGVVIPLVNVIMCTVWTFGFMGIAGIPLDLITATLPVFLITICSSDAIHVMSEYYQQRSKQSNQKNAVNMTMRLMLSPVILTTLTTCVTFIISTTTSISSLRNFGICISFGMFVAMIISLLLIPAWLSLLSDKTLDKILKKNRQPPLISQLLLRCMAPVIKYRNRFGVGSTVVLIALITIGFQVRIDDMGSGYFAKDNTFRVADDFINSHIAGTSPGWIEIDTGAEGGALTSETVQFVDALEKFIHKQDNITYSYSVARYVRRMNLVFNNMDSSYDRLPNTVETFHEVDEDTGEKYTVDILGKDIISQSVLMYENGGGSDLTNVLSEDFSKTLLLYTMNTTVASDFQRYLDQLEPWLSTHIPDGMTYKLAGSPVIWTAVLDELISSQLTSIVIALACVFLIMSLWMRSFRTGLLGTLPLLVTVIFYYAAMTLFNIELNIGTAIISFLVLGIVDYSVHYLLRIDYGLKQGLSLTQSLEDAVIYSGRSIIINIIVFSMGFIALLFSEFKPIVDLGTLVGLSLFVSGVMSIFMITLLAPWLIKSPISEREEKSIVAT